MLNELSTGRIIKAPENFLGKDGIKTVFAEAKNGRRDFIRTAFAAAAAGVAAPAVMAQGNPVPTEGGDPNILKLPEHSTGLGQGVSSEGSYGKPSKFESNVQRRQSPGLTQTTQAWFPLRPCSLCLASSRPVVCTLSATTKVGGILTRPSTV